MFIYQKNVNCRYIFSYNYLQLPDYRKIKNNSQNKEHLISPQQNTSDTQNGLGASSFGPDAVSFKSLQRKADRHSKDVNITQHQTNADRSISDLTQLQTAANNFSEDNQIQLKPKENISVPLNSEAIYPNAIIQREKDQSKLTGQAADTSEQVDAPFAIVGGFKDIAGAVEDARNPPETLEAEFDGEAAFGESLGFFKEFAAMVDSGAKAWQDGKIADGAKVFTGATKTSLQAVDVIKNLGAFALDSAGTALLFGAKSGIAAFEEAINMANNQHTWDKIGQVKDKASASLEPDEIAVLDAYRARLDSKLALSAIEFVWDIAELISIAGGPIAMASVKTAHAVFNGFKLAFKAYHSYETAKGDRAEDRVGITDGRVSKDSVRSLHTLQKQLKSKDGSYSLRPIMESHMLASELDMKIKNTKLSAKEKAKLSLERDGAIKFTSKGIKVYNETFLKESDKKITISDVQTLAEVHKSTVAKIITQVNKEVSRWKKFKAFFRKIEGKKKALEKLQEAFMFRYSSSVEFDPENVKLAELKEAETEEYFWGKTQDAITIAATRKWQSDDKITENVTKLLKSRPDLFKEIIQEVDKKAFDRKDIAESEAVVYQHAVERFMRRARL